MSFIEELFYGDLEEVLKPVSVTVDFVNMNSGATESTTYTVECDDAGNIVKLINAKGYVIHEFEYEKVTSPSVAARVNASVCTLYD